MLLNTLRAVALIAAVASVTAPTRAEPDPEPDLFSLQIDIGRLDVMLGQGEDGLELILKNTNRATTHDGPPSVEELYAQLAHVITRYNALLTQTCLADETQDGLCNAYYTPGWLKPPGAKLRKKDRDPAKLEKRIWEVYGVVTALSGDLCARGAEIAEDEYFCAIE